MFYFLRPLIPFRITVLPLYWLIRFYAGWLGVQMTLWKNSIKLHKFWDARIVAQGAPRKRLTARKQIGWSLSLLIFSEGEYCNRWYKNLSFLFQLTLHNNFNLCFDELLAPVYHSPPEFPVAHPGVYIDCYFRNSSNSAPLMVQESKVGQRHCLNEMLRLEWGSPKPCTMLSHVEAIVIVSQNLVVSMCKQLRCFVDAAINLLKSPALKPGSRETLHLDHRHTLQCTCREKISSLVHAWPLMPGSFMAVSALCQTRATFGRGVFSSQSMKQPLSNVLSVFSLFIDLQKSLAEWFESVPQSILVTFCRHSR